MTSPPPPGPLRLAQQLWFALIVRPVMHGWIGMRVSGREHLPRKGPAILVANHNSHLDTSALMALLPLGLLRHVHPLAAADYFLKPSLTGWMARHLYGILAIERSRPAEEAGEGARSDPLAPALAALDAGAVLILYPEGTRGEPEQIQPFRTGVARLMQARPEIPLIPVFLHGMGKVLPKGAVFPLPLTVEIAVQPPTGPELAQQAGGDVSAMTARLEGQFRALAAARAGQAWL